VSFDNSRFTFDPWKDYTQIVMAQGHVQTDADLNEGLSEISRRIQAGTLDAMGHAAYPATTPYAFQIAASNAGGKNTINIGLGRMYIDGILVENHGEPKTAVWDPALAELSNTPQPPPVALLPLDSSNSIGFDNQPYNPGATVPSGNGQYLAYLDVWQRPVTFIEDASLIDEAIGVDTTGRIQTAWQVVLRPLPGATVAGAVTSGTFDSGEEVIQSNTGASANLIGTVTGSGPMNMGSITGSANGTDTWIGQTSNAVFTPSAVPVGAYSTITGSVTSGTFIANENVVQSNSGANANLIGSASGAGPLLIAQITGTANGTDTWVGQTSEAIFTPTAAPVPSVWSCATPDSAIPWPTSSGHLTNGTVTSGPSGPCCLTTGSGYTGVENQFYRVEIHSPGTQGGADATFKWSRENASVQTQVTEIASGSNTLGDPASVLTVQSLGRDQVLGFTAGNWIEITNQLADDNCLPGELYKIDSVDVSSMTITLTTSLSSNFPASSISSNDYTRITRWDQPGKIYKSDNSLYYDLDKISSGTTPNGFNGIPVPMDGSTLILENGITVKFGLSLTAGTYQCMNYWNFAARSADGSIERLHKAPPRGIYHHYTKLSIVTFGTSVHATDCRTPATSNSGECDCCCTCTVGDGTISFGKYTSIQQAVQSLPDAGGEVCLLPGNYYENIVLDGLSNVVIHGCGWQTQVSSKSLQPGASAGPSGTATAPASGLNAVFTIMNCMNIELRSFAVSAADEEVGILMDRAVMKDGQSGDKSNGTWMRSNFSKNVNIKIKDLVLTASTLPAIAARAVMELKILENRITMEDVYTIYPAVYLSGNNIFFEHNLVSLAPRESSKPLRMGLEKMVLNKDIKDIVTEKNPTGVYKGPVLTTDNKYTIQGIGGVQIAGPSANVFIVENRIEGGSRNGITLGNIINLDQSGVDDGTIAGITIKLSIEDQCCAGGTGSGSLPGSSGSGSNTTYIGAGGTIRNLYIDRNVIAKTGMSGIGPVGFFDLKTSSEVISLVNVNITANTITNTLVRKLQEFDPNQSLFGYGAISLPDVQNLIIRDNTITDYGVTPGEEVCGIFVLNGEGIEISRNQIRETRDLHVTHHEVRGSYGGVRAGIYIYVVTPQSIHTYHDFVWEKVAPSQPGGTVGQSVDYHPMYAPGFSALRIQENVVRVALGLALNVQGTGPYSIVGNHFSTGGRVMISSDASGKLDFAAPDLQSIGISTGAMTVSILNLGLAIEALEVLSYLKSYNSDGGSSLSGDGKGAPDATNGTVLFTNNICQFEGQTSGVRGVSSVAILSLDHVLFSSNQLWVNGPASTAFMDAFIFGISLEATSNRLQESLTAAVLCSAVTFGWLNITSQNIATYCLFPFAPDKKSLVDGPNLVINRALCPDNSADSTGNLAGADMKGYEKP